MPNTPESIKRNLIVRARALQPFDRDLGGIARVLREEWKQSGRCHPRALDDALWNEFDGALNDVFASRIPIPRSLAEVRTLAGTLAREIGQGTPVDTESHHVSTTGVLRKKEEHSVRKASLFRGTHLYSRRMHEGMFLANGWSDQLSSVFEKNFELWLRDDGTIMAAEATETGLMASGTWWTSRTVEVATDHHLFDPDYIYKRRRLKGHLTKEEFMYEFERWKPGAQSGTRPRIGLILRDYLFNVRRSRGRTSIYPE